MPQQQRSLLASKNQLMHIEMFLHYIIHAECPGGEIGLLCDRRNHRLLPLALRGRGVKHRALRGLRRR